MKKILLLLSGFLCIQFANAQLEAADKADKFVKTITKNDLEKHLEIISSDAYEGREAGTRGQKKAAQYLARQFEDFGLKPVVQRDGKATYFQEFFLRNMGWGMMEIAEDLSATDTRIHTENVLGFLEGTDKKDEIIVITAHYDHLGIKHGKIHNGADDDGSGTVALLEMAEAFSKASKAGKAPRRSILFMAVSAEEKGLLGSKYFTDYDPVFPLENIVANLNIDMIGREDEAHKGNSDYVYLIGSDRLSSELHKLNETVNKKLVGMELDYKYNDENDPNHFYERSDHYNFAKNDIPVIFYFSGVHDDYHQPTDTEDKINYKKLQKTTQLVFLTAWELAGRKERVAVDADKR